MHSSVYDDSNDFRSYHIGRQTNSVFLEMVDIVVNRRVPKYKPGKHWLASFFIRVSQTPK